MHQQKSNSEVTTLAILGLVVFALIYYLYPGIFSHASFSLPQTSGAGQSAINSSMTATQMINTEFGQYAPQALKIANCESGMNPNAIGTHSGPGNRDMGLFQIETPATWDTTSYANDNPLDAATNTKAAYEIFRRDGYNWHEWACARIVGV